MGRNVLTVPQNTRTQNRSCSSARSRSSEKSITPEFPSLAPRESLAPSSCDPFALRRFTTEQKTWQARAMTELRHGAKTSCWMWYIMPTPPHIVNGIEKGSSNNVRNAIRSDEEAHAYLAFEADDVNLRNNYIEIISA